MPVPYPFEPGALTFSVADLIEHLKTYPPDLPVILEDSDYGLGECDKTSVRLYIAEHADDVSYVKIS